MMGHPPPARTSTHNARDRLEKMKWTVAHPADARGGAGCLAWTWFDIRILLKNRLRGVYRGNERRGRLMTNAFFTPCLVLPVGALAFPSVF